MKKILILLGSLIFSLFTFGNDNYNDDATVNITAEFLAPINIITTDASFGTVIAQTYNKGSYPSTNSGTSGAKNGTLSITGDGQVFISWKDVNSNTDFKSSSTKLDVILKKDGDTLNSQFWITDTIKKNISNIGVTEKGVKLDVVGELIDVSAQTPSGVYKGAITIRVSYNNSND